MDHFADLALKLTDGVPILGITTICVNSLYAKGWAGINFYCSPNPVSKVFFGASCLCGMMGAVLSGIALATLFETYNRINWIIEC